MSVEFASTQQQHGAHELPLQRRILRTKRRAVYDLQPRDVQPVGRKYSVHAVPSRFVCTHPGSDRVFDVCAAVWDVTAGER